MHRLCLFYSWCLRCGESTAGLESHFSSPAARWKSPTVDIVYDRATLRQSCSRQRLRVMNTLGACSEMKALIHQAPVRRTLLTTCAINFTNEQCHVGFGQKTNKTLY